MQWLLLLLALVPLAPHGFILKEDESFLQLPHYTSQAELEDLFARLEKAYPEQARVHYIGRSLEGRSLLALQISQNTRQRSLLVPPVKYIANMHGDETVGRQLLVYLAQYLLGNYERILDVSQLVNSTDIFLMPTMNPDGYARSQVCFCLSHLFALQNCGKINMCVCVSAFLCLSVCVSVSVFLYEISVAFSFAHTRLRCCCFSADVVVVVLPTHLQQNFVACFDVDAAAAAHINFNCARAKEPRPFDVDILQSLLRLWVVGHIQAHTHTQAKHTYCMCYRY